VYKSHNPDDLDSQIRAEAPFLSEITVFSKHTHFIKFIM
jgi:hypothetical protein